MLRRHTGAPHRSRRVRFPPPARSCSVLRSWGAAHSGTSRPSYLFMRRLHPASAEAVRLRIHGIMTRATQLFSSHVAPEPRADRTRACGLFASLAQLAVATASYAVGRRFKSNGRLYRSHHAGLAERPGSGLPHRPLDLSPASPARRSVRFRRNALQKVSFPVATRRRAAHPRG